METEVARIIRRALFVHRKARIRFVVALAILTPPISLDARAENLTLHGIMKRRGCYLLDRNPIWSHSYLAFRKDSRHAHG